MSTATTLSVNQLQAEWTEFHRLACSVIRRKLVRFRQRYDDELFGEAIAFAWVDFQRCRQHGLATRHAICLAASGGAGRALRGRRFIAGERGYVDALRASGTVRMGEAVAALVPDRDATVAVHDAADRGPVEAIIARLPAHVQETARLLSQGGLRQYAIAQRLGLSNATVCRHVELIEVFLRAILDERKVQPV